MQLTVNYPKPKPKSARVRKPLSWGDHWEQRIAEAAELAAAGATVAEMCEFFDCDTKTLYAWQAAQPRFRAACTENKAAADARVQGVAFTMTQGFRYTEQQAIKVRTGEHTEEIEVVDVERYMPPDKTLVIFWLKNRMGWRDVQDHKVQGEIEHKHTIVDDPRRLAIALLATLRKGMEVEGPLVIEGEVSESHD